MTRITNKQLEFLVLQINKATNNPITYCDTVGSAPFKSNIGHYHLEGDFKGMALAQVDNEMGGIRSITRYMTKRELYDSMEMFLEGIKLGSKK